MASCAPSDLLKAAKCLACLPVGMARAVKAYLACQWANQGSGPVAPPAPLSITIDLASASDHIVVNWTQGAAPTTNEIWRDVNGFGFVLFATVAGGITTITDPGVMANGDLYTYKVRACNGATCSTFSSEIAVGYNLVASGTGLYPSLFLVIGSFFMYLPTPTVSAPNLVKVDAAIDASNNVTLTTLNLPALVTVGGNFRVNQCTSLASLTSTALQTVGGDFLFGQNPITALDFPALLSTGGTFSPNGMAGLLTLNIPLLASTGQHFSFGYGNAITTLYAPSLVTVGHILDGSGAGVNLVTVLLPNLISTGNDFRMENNPTLTSLTITNLQTVGTNTTSGNLTCYNCSLTAFSAPALTAVWGDAVLACTTMVSISLPNLVTLPGSLQCGGFTLGVAVPGLTTVSIPKLLIGDANQIDFDSCALVAGSSALGTGIAGILHRCVVAVLTTEDIELGNVTGGGANAALATCGAQAIADNNTLTVAGCTVVTN